jgi:transposase-like protein
MDDLGKPLLENKKRGAPSGNKRAIGNSGGGRKPKYQTAMAGIARRACERGLTDQEVADLLGVNPSTLYRWRAQYRQFSRAFRLGKELANNRVERALYERAIGYDYEVEKQIMTRHGPQMLRWREHLPPDVTAALAYLKNRRPDRWCDRQIVEHQQRTPYDGIGTAAELRALLQKQAQQLGLIPPPVINITPQQGVTGQKATDQAPGDDIER